MEEEKEDEDKEESRGTRGGQGGRRRRRGRDGARGQGSRAEPRAPSPLQENLRERGRRRSGRGVRASDVGGAAAGHAAQAREQTLPKYLASAELGCAARPSHRLLSRLG